MKNATAVIWMVAIFAILVWVLLKDRDELFLTLGIPGVGTVAAGGRNCYARQVARESKFNKLS